MLVIFIVITFVDLVTMALFANVTRDSRQWMAAQLAALPRISITLIHGTDVR